MITILKSKQELLRYIEKVKNQNKIIGFAPTMGALHEGHLSLYKEAKEKNDIVISSIFINPTQFNNREDLEKYPRNLEQDIAILKNSGLVDAVYTPSTKDIYPDNTESKDYNFGGIEKEMEGEFRPGHFNGVATVVEELFNQVQPDNAYFGEKDFQQLAIIKKLVVQKGLKVTIHGVPIYREKSGLAMSSRNERLSDEQKKDASLLYETLCKTKDWISEYSLSTIKDKVATIFQQKKGFQLDYFIIADESTLQEIDHISPKTSARAFLVVWVGDVRLIDNMSL